MNGARLSVRTATLLTLFAAWLLMLLGDWFLPWFVVPDMVLLAWIALRFALDSVPLWAPLLFVSVLLFDGGVDVGST